MWTFSVERYDAAGMSPLELAERGGCPACDRNTAAQAGEKVEALTLNGREAARSAFGGETRRYFVRQSDYLYKVELYAGLAGVRPAVLPLGVLDAVAATLEISQPQPIAAPAAAPQVPPASSRVTAADLQAALESRDATRAANLMTPMCWLETWVSEGGPTGRAVEPYAAELRTRFAEGLQIRVDPTVQVAPEDGPGRLRLFVHSSWTESGRTSRADLYLREAQGRWYWGGVRHYPPEP